MCGRYQLKSEPDVLQTLFDGFLMSGHRPRYNIAPTQLAPIIRIEDGKLVFRDLRFGLIPSWAQEPPSTPLVNARSESVFEKPSFRSSMQFQRCLVPATGFYEWQKNGSSRDAFLIRMEDSPVITFAGIWASWQDRAHRIESFAILTRSAGSQLSKIHQRVPIAIKANNQDLWLSPETSKYSVEALLGEPDGDHWQIEAISARVNDVRYDDPSCEAPRAVQQSLF